MIDTHCHLLPGIDDGPHSELESIRLARRLGEEGVELVLCTPHYSTRYETSADECERRLVRLETVLRELNIPLELRLAAEISPTLALEAAPQEIRRRSIGGRYVIVELEPATTWQVVDAALDRVDAMGLHVVLAHPERCRALRRALDVLRGARARGALVQVVAPSLVGTWGIEARLVAWRLVEDGIADLVASDAHAATPARNLSAVARLIGERYGEQRRQELFEVTPRKLVSGAGDVVPESRSPARTAADAT